MKTFFSGAMAVLFLFGCREQPGIPIAEAAGVEKSMRATSPKSLEEGNRQQIRAPIEQRNTYLVGFHFVSGEMWQQSEAHYFVTELDEDVSQAVIFDGNHKNAHLIGVEYIVSQRIFASLPDEEKKLWHSHAYEVESGQLIAPNLSNQAEHDLMKKLGSTYGKTIYTWNPTSVETRVPLGIPQLMMGFTEDGQVDGRLLTKRDQRFGISADEKRLQRQDIKPPGVLPGADSWQEGSVPQLDLQEFTVPPWNWAVGGE